MEMTLTKRILMAVFACCLTAAPSMFGANLNTFCTPLGTFTAGGGPPATETCGPFGGGTIGSGVGQDTISNVRLWFVTGYTTGFGTSNIVNITYGTPSAGNFAAPASPTCVISG